MSGGVIHQACAALRDNYNLRVSRPSRGFVLIACRLYVIFCIMTLVLLAGCQPETSSLPPSPTPDVLQTLLLKAQAALDSKEYERSALAYRDALNLLEEGEASEEKLAPIREKCTQALIQAGGFVGSRQLWLEMAQKNPESQSEATRMVSRAEKMMKLQGDELVGQAEFDLKEGHRNRAISTVSAALQLYDIAGGSEPQVKAATTLLETIKSGKTPDSAKASPTPKA